MALIGVFLFAIYAWLFFAIVVAPLLVVCCLIVLILISLRIRNEAVGGIMCGASCAGIVVCVVWVASNDPVGVIRLIGG